MALARATPAAAPRMHMSAEVATLEIRSCSQTHSHSHKRARGAAGEQGADGASRPTRWPHCQPCCWSRPGLSSRRRDLAG